jgi:hypothetical protein
MLSLGKLDTKSMWPEGFRLKSTLYGNPQTSSSKCVKEFVTPIRNVFACQKIPRAQATLLSG